jgi:hypothetical protein
VDRAVYEQTVNLTTSYIGAETTGPWQAESPHEAIGCDASFKSPSLARWRVELANVVAMHITRL